MLTSCATKKDILYFQDINTNTINTVFYTSTKIQINDILNIRISAIVPESVIPFNIQNPGGTSGGQSPEMAKINGYLVSTDGSITFPIIGKIIVVNKTTKEVEEILKNTLESQGLLINPIINVRILNSKITILGDISKPGTYSYPEENITLLQAIGYAGDLSISAKRQEILIIREEDSKRTYATIDLRKTDWFNGPYYYIKQNDIIYVNPNGPKIKSAGYITTWTGVLSVFTTGLTLYLLLTR